MSTLIYTINKLEIQNAKTISISGTYQNIHYFNIYYKQNLIERNVGV